MIEKLYPYRFEIFFFSQVTILFGSLIVPSAIFENIVSPILFLINLLAGVLLLSTKKNLMWFFVVLLLVSGVVFGSSLFENRNEKFFNFIRMITYFLFYVVVTFEIIMQVWKAEFVNKNVILGLISGYVSLGLIGFFICISIEMADHGSFKGLMLDSSNRGEMITEELMYYSYITMLTIGYGDIVPVTSLSKKAAILIGLIGQFYLVIVTAIVVGKYINQLHRKKD